MMPPKPTTYIPHDKTTECRRPPSEQLCATANRVCVVTTSPRGSTPRNIHGIEIASSWLLNNLRQASWIAYVPTRDGAGLMALRMPILLHSRHQHVARSRITAHAHARPHTRQTPCQASHTEALPTNCMLQHPRLTSCWWLVHSSHSAN